MWYVYPFMLLPVVLMCVFGVSHSSWWQFPVCVASTDLRILIADLSVVFCWGLLLFKRLLLCLCLQPHTYSVFIIPYLRKTQVLSRKRGLCCNLLHFLKMTIYRHQCEFLWYVSVLFCDILTQLVFICVAYYGSSKFCISDWTRFEACHCVLCHLE